MHTVGSTHSFYALEKILRAHALQRGVGGEIESLVARLLAAYASCCFLFHRFLLVLLLLGFNVAVGGATRTYGSRSDTSEMQSVSPSGAAAAVDAGAVSVAAGGAFVASGRTVDLLRISSRRTDRFQMTG
jgi:hypothetical protein